MTSDFLVTHGGSIYIYNLLPCLITQREGAKGERGYAPQIGEGQPLLAPFSVRYEMRSMRLGGLERLHRWTLK